jgi:hypothetical protein
LTKRWGTTDQSLAAEGMTEGKARCPNASIAQAIEMA